MVKQFLEDIGLIEAALEAAANFIYSWDSKKSHIPSEFKINISDDEIETRLLPVVNDVINAAEFEDYVKKILFGLYGIGRPAMRITKLAAELGMHASNVAKTRRQAVALLNTSECHQKYGIRVGLLLTCSEKAIKAYKKEAEREISGYMSEISALEERIAKIEEKIKIPQEIIQVDANVSATSRSIDELGLCARTYKCLINSGITTIGGLLALTPQSLMLIPNFGVKSLRDVEKRLSRYGLRL